MVQWSGLYAFTAMGPDSIPGRGTKIPQATWRGWRKKKVNEINILYYCKSSTWSLRAGLHLQFVPENLSTKYDGCHTIISWRNTYSTINVHVGNNTQSNSFWCENSDGVWSARPRVGSHLLGYFTAFWLTDCPAFPVWAALPASSGPQTHTWRP